MTITFAGDELQLRALYRHPGGANPGTRRRAREVGELVRAGLKRVFDALEGGEISLVGEAGFEVREDVIAVDEKGASE